ncbi:MAG: trypsin-like serine protease [Gammaproteobacteria bacterium]
MTSHSRMGARVSIAALFAWSACATAQNSIRTLDVDVSAMIAAAADEGDRFAQDFPQTIHSDRDGEWTQTTSTSIWHFAVHVPGAVSLSFRATPVALPAGATLTVRNGLEEYVYTPADVQESVLWSRISKGADLVFEMTVPSQDREHASFSIDRIQVGFRSLDSATSDSSKLKIQSVEGDAGNCIQNYSCVTTAANSGPAKATVALVVANVLECTGTLLNDVPGDNTPYVLTARHCQTGTAGNRDPTSASSVTVYWNAFTPCGEVLHTFYQSKTPRQTGAVTVVEQEDAWLIRLNQKPVTNDVYFAGFDATGGVVEGGYTVHHGSTYTKQLANWFGQAFSARKTATSLGGRYTSHFLGVVNQAGSIAGGASGGALFDQNNRVTGSLSLGSTDTQACPAEPLRVPSATNVVAEFTSFAAVWNSTTDTSSSTGGATLRSVLDPRDSGRLIVNGATPGAVASLDGLDQPVSASVDPPVANQTGDSGKGGGGALDWVSLLALTGIGVLAGAARRLSPLRSRERSKSRAALAPERAI